LVYLALVSGSLIALTQIFSGYSVPNPVQAVALLAGQGLVILGIVAAASSVLSPVAAGLVGFMAYGVSFVGSIVQQVGELLQSQRAEQIGQAVGYLVPSQNFYRMGVNALSPQLGLLDQLQNQMGPFGGIPVDWWLIIYGMLYLAACLLLAGYLFRRKDL
jgi:Cu-processing system permease protein